jgi:erythromycin esterase-like protein
MPTLTQITDAVSRLAYPLNALVPDYAPLLRRVGNARFALLGEASHGTHEFYRERARITKRLIERHGVMAVAVEADWPDAARVNRYVRGVSADAHAEDALVDFKRFPTWMWRNTEVVEFVEWLRLHNEALPADEPKVGFYGLDLYSLRASMQAVLRYLQAVDPQAAARVRERYACFDHFSDDAQIYGLLTQAGVSRSCEEDVIRALIELQHRPVAGHEDFNAVQNARLVKNAEAYYRTMFLENVSSWNLRDRHMMETFAALVTYLERRTPRANIAVWAHNSHLGDARATDMSGRGEWNVGQLARERYGRDTILIGFTTHHGTVTAASNWDAPAERKNVRPALVGSYEAMFHATKRPRFLLTWDADDSTAQQLGDARLERAIGVIYRPDTERQSHYFHARLAEQFDAVVHFDETHAVEPLERTAQWDAGEVPETYPFSV